MASLVCSDIDLYIAELYRYRWLCRYSNLTSVLMLSKEMDTVCEC